MPLMVEGEIIFGTRKYSNIFLWRQTRVEREAKGLIIWAKDEGKEMGFRSFTFTIILRSSSLEKEALLLVDWDCVERKENGLRFYRENTTIFYQMLCTSQSQDTIKRIDIVMYNKCTKHFLFFIFVFCGWKLKFFSIIWVIMTMELTHWLVNVPIRATYFYTEEIIRINKLPLFWHREFKSKFFLRIMLCLLPPNMVLYISFINWIVKILY